MGLRIVFGVALAAAAVAFGVALATPSQHRTGTNLMPAASYVRTVTGHTKYCQDEGRFPADTGEIVLGASPARAPSPRLRVQVVAAGRQIVEGAVAAGWKAGSLRFRVRPMDRDIGPVRVCLDIRSGPHVSLLGYAGKVRLDFYEASKRSWFSYLGTLAYRVHQGKSAWLGGWLLWVTIVLLLAALAIGTITFLRAANRED